MVLLISFKLVGGKNYACKTIFLSFEKFAEEGHKREGDKREQ